MKKLHNYPLGRLLIIISLTLNAFTFNWGGVQLVKASSKLSEAESQNTSRKQTYDDHDKEWMYNGNWSEMRVRHAYRGKLHISNTIGNSAEISITGSGFTLIFAKAENYGKLDVYVDGSKLETINQKRAKTSNQMKWMSPEIVFGLHSVKFVHTAGNAVNIDAIKVREPISAPASTSIPMSTLTSTAVPPDFPGPVGSPSATELPASTALPSATSTSPVENPTSTLLPESTATPSQIPSSSPSFTPTIVPTSTLNPTNTAIPTFTSTALPTATVNPTATNSSSPITGANVYYVSVNGSDGNVGSQTQPWRTLQKAANSVTAGATVYLRSGVYTESVTFSRSGTASQPIQVLAYPGETPILDGNNTLAANWGALLKVAGAYVDVAGLEIRNSAGMCVLVSGAHSQVQTLHVHHCAENGILVTGDYALVENSQVHDAALSRASGWASGLSAARHPNAAVLRGNTVYHNMGEGVSTYEANGTVIEDNTIYDNWSANLYISDATNVVVQRNLIYGPDTSQLTSGSRVGIMLGDETYNPPSSNLTIINNLVYGTYRNFYWWQGAQGGGMLNVLVAHNTFVNSRVTAGVQINSGPHQNVRFVNNLVQQEGSLPVLLLGAASGITFSHNLWSKTPPSAATGSGDLVADPKLAKTGSFTSPDWYSLQTTSPARDTAIQLGEVPNDFFKNPRGNLPNIGALE